MIIIICTPLTHQATIQRHYSTSNLISRTKSRSVSSRINLTLINIKQTRILIFGFFKQSLRFLLGLNQQMFYRNILAQIGIQLSIISMIANGQRFIPRYQTQIFKRLKNINSLHTNVLIVHKNQSNLDLIKKPTRMNFDLKIALFEAIPGLFGLGKVHTSQLNWVQDFQRCTGNECILSGFCGCYCKVMGVVF